MAEDGVVGRTGECHSVSAVLAKTDAMSPATAVERHPEDITGGIPFDVEIEQTVSKSQQRSKTEGSKCPAATRTDDLRVDRPFGLTPFEHTHILKFANVQRLKRGIELLPGLVGLPQGQSRVTIGRRVGAR